MKNEIKLNQKKWNKKEYLNYIEYLQSLKDENYKKFHSSLVLNSKYEMIGIRVPIMRKIAKEISQSDIKEFLKYVQNFFYEEVMIEGLVISSIRKEEIFYIYFKNFIKKVDNWAICDSFCNSIKIIRQFEEKYFNESIKLSLRKEEFESRIGLVMILNHFISYKNLNTIFATLNKIQSDKLYINMAEAWLICEIYIKFPNETKEFLENNNLSKFTQNKAISKIHDSFRISKDEKQMLNLLRKV